MKRPKARAVVLAGAVAAAVGVAAPAHADPYMFSGHYTETETDDDGSHPVTNEWDFTPCDKGCATLTNVTDTPQVHLDLSAMSWSFDTIGTAVCDDNSEVPHAHASHYVWSDTTLRGRVFMTVKIASCGDAAGATASNPIKLVRAS